MMQAIPSPSRNWGKAASAWRGVPDSDSSDHRWQLKNTIRSASDLRRLLGLSDAEVLSITTLQRDFRFAITPYYFSLIDATDPLDPIRRMIVPSSLEQVGEGEVDPLGERADQVAPGLTHRYPDRVLFVVTAFCSSYCRFCIRKRNW